MLLYWEKDLFGKGPYKVLEISGATFRCCILNVHNIHNFQYRNGLWFKVSESQSIHWDYDLPSTFIVLLFLLIKLNLSNTVTTNFLRQEMCRFDGIILPMNSEKDKEHAMMTRQDKVIKTPVMELRTRQIVREAKKRKASPKLEDVCFNRKQASKFMTLAEKIMHFHEDTPPRFKTKFTSLEGGHLFNS